MLDHLSLQVADTQATTAFYLRVPAPLGFREARRVPTPYGNHPEAVPHGSPS
jgi:catechol 2,3-dioxygenase-like lactoylglutathione lyase family enzyme